MTPALIITQIQTQLQNSSDLSYVNDAHILIGRRTSIANYPVIIIEPAGDRVVSRTYPYENIIKKIIVAGGLRVFNESTQVVGSGENRGMEDFKNDIKKALCSDHTLGGQCIDLNIIDSEDDDGSDYPVRGFAINIEVEFRQNVVTRV